MLVYKNSDMTLAINEYVHNPKYRKILLLRFCDGMTYEEIAEESNYSPDHVKRLCRKYRPLLMSCI